jgi:holo-[acyl-carrier protein] synthase
MFPPGRTLRALAVDLPLQARYNLAIPSELVVQRRRALVVGLGIDIVDIDEFRSGPAASRPEAFFLPGELEYARTQARSWENLAARLAGKRAVMRALGADASDADCSDAEPAWHEVEIIRNETGELDVRLSGDTGALAKARGISACMLSVTHTRRTALATAILETEGP